MRAKRRSKSAVYIYLRSILTAGAPGSTFFFGLNHDVREIVYSVFKFIRSRLLNKIEMLFDYCPYSIVYISITIDNQQIMSSTSITGSSSHVSKHIPGIKLTDKERADKCAKYKFGLCCSCDAGFDQRCEYIHYPHPSGVYSVCMCVGCIGYYAETGQLFDFDKFLEGGYRLPNDGNGGGR